MARRVVQETNLPGIPVRRGKVRDVYDLGDELLLVATDRISAFDWVLPTGIPDKGILLSRLSAFWFGFLGEPNHVISSDLANLQAIVGHHAEMLAGRSMRVRKADVVPIECVVRGYLAGSAWKEYREGGTVCGQRLPDGLVCNGPLPAPIFTPATKAATGHDENISYDQVCDLLGLEVASELARRSIAVYQRGRDYAAARGILIADTKFEWGWHAGELILIDEVLTPDSSRFWPESSYVPGGPVPSYDKQFVRDWLESTAWDKNSPPPPLPEAVVHQTRKKYVQAFETLTGTVFDG